MAEFRDDGALVGFDDDLRLASLMWVLDGPQRALYPRGFAEGIPTITILCPHPWRSKYEQASAQQAPV
jgi:hypothetical protein